MSELLKPCPFCGGPAYLNENVVRIHCPSCCGKGVLASVEIRRQIGERDMEKCTAEAIAAWNRRQEANPLTVKQIDFEAIALEISQDRFVQPRRRKSTWCQRAAEIMQSHILAALPPDQSARIAELEEMLEEIKRDLKAPLQLEMPFEKAVRSALMRTDDALARIKAGQS